MTIISPDRMDIYYQEVDKLYCYWGMSGDAGKEVLMWNVVL